MYAYAYTYVLMYVYTYVLICDIEESLVDWHVAGCVAYYFD